MGTPLNVKQWAIASLVVFVIMTIFAYVPNKLELAPWVASAGTTVAGPAENPMGDRILFYLARLISASLFTFIFTKGHEGKSGMGEGVRYGLWIGLLFCLPGFLQGFVITQWTAGELTVYALAGIVQFICCGAAVSQLYKPGKA